MRACVVYNNCGARRETLKMCESVMALRDWEREQHNKSAALVSSSLGNVLYKYIEFKGLLFQYRKPIHT